MRIWGPLLLLATFLFTPTNSYASATDEVIAALKAQVEALNARLAALEAETTEIKTITVAAKPAAPVDKKTAGCCGDNITLKGDFRYRHEAFDVDNRRDRHRQRMRARVSATGKVSDTVTAGFGLATGGSDPISTNQTFGDASSSKGVVIDLAYITWKTPVEGLEVRAGKFKNPLHRAGGHGLVWDGDLNPEGLGLTYKKGALFANALGSWVDESSSDDDTFLIGGQFGVKQGAGDNGAIVAGIGYYNYLDAEGEPAFFDGSAMGNRLNPDGTYVSGFEIIEGFVEYAADLNDGKLTLFADYVQNLDADDFDQGWAAGAKFKKDKWQVGYTYQELEADAVLGTFSDSDFIGGGTDGEGHILSAGYSISKSISLKGTLFLNDRNIDFGTEEEYKRLMLDISFKY